LDRIGAAVIDRGANGGNDRDRRNGEDQSDIAALRALKVAHDATEAKHDICDLHRGQPNWFAHQ
jgi:hypothetical protein